MITTISLAVMDSIALEQVNEKKIISPKYFSVQLLRLTKKNKCFGCTGIVYGTGSGYTYNQASNSYGYPNNYNSNYNPYGSTYSGAYPSGSYNSPYKYNNYNNAYNGYNTGYNQYNNRYNNGGYGYNNNGYNNGYYPNSQRVIGLPYNQGYTQQYNSDGYVYWSWEKHRKIIGTINEHTHAHTQQQQLII